MTIWPCSEALPISRGFFRAALFCALPPCSCAWRPFRHLLAALKPPAESAVSVSDRLAAKLRFITGNPAAENELPGTGLAGRLLQLRLTPGCGSAASGWWIRTDSSPVAPQPGKWSWNSALIIVCRISTPEKLLNLQGASFGVQFSSSTDRTPTFRQAACKAINSLPVAKPLDRSELYQLWYARLSSTIRSSSGSGNSFLQYEFNKVARPVPTGMRH